MGMLHREEVSKTTERLKVEEKICPYCGQKYIVFGTEEFRQSAVCERCKEGILEKFKEIKKKFNNPSSRWYR